MIYLLLIFPLVVLAMVAWLIATDTLDNDRAILGLILFLLDLFVFGIVVAAVAS